MVHSVRSTFTISHWLPIVTYCPVNGFPDLIYVYITFDINDFHELYQTRKDIRNAVKGKKLFMEDIAKFLQELYVSALVIEVRLMTGRHSVTLHSKYQL